MIRSVSFDGCLRKKHWFSNKFRGSSGPHAKFAPVQPIKCMFGIIALSLCRIREGQAGSRACVAKGRISRICTQYTVPDAGEVAKGNVQWGRAVGPSVECAEAIENRLFPCFARGSVRAASVHVRYEDVSCICGWTGENPYLVQQVLSILRQVIAVSCQCQHVQ